jgi:hypothetical protein
MNVRLPALLGLDSSLVDELAIGSSVNGYTELASRSSLRIQQHLEVYPSGANGGQVQQLQLAVWCLSM